MFTIIRQHKTGSKELHFGLLFELCRIAFKFGSSKHSGMKSPERQMYHLGGVGTYLTCAQHVRTYSFRLAWTWQDLDGDLGCLDMAGFGW